MTDPTRDATPNAAPSKICPRHGLPFDPTKARGCTRCYEEARARAAQKKAAQKKAAAAGAATPDPAATATVQTVRTPLPKTWPAQPQPVSVLCQRHAQPFDPTKHRGCAKCYEEARARAAQKKAAQGAPQAPAATAAPQAHQAAPASPATQASTTPAPSTPAPSTPAPSAPAATASTTTVQTVRTPLPKTWPAQSQPISVRCQRHEQTFDPTKVRGCPKCYEEARARAAQKKAAQQAPPQPAPTAPPEAAPNKPSGLPPLPSPVSSEAKADAAQSGLQTVATPLPRTWPPRAEPVSVRCQRHEQTFDPTKVRGCPKCYEEARARAAQKKAAQEAAARGETPSVAEPAPASSSSMPFYEIARPATPPAEETEAAGTPSYQLAQPPPPPPGAPEAPATADASPQAAEPGATAPRPPRPPRPRPVRRPPPPPKASVAQGLWAAVLLIAFTGFGLLLKHQAIYNETQAFMNAPYEEDYGGLTDEELQDLPPEVRELLETNGYVDDEDYSYEYYEEE